MATGKLWELARLPDMPSAPTLRQFVRDRPDFPVLQRGRKGLEYLFDLDDAAAFVRVHWRDSRTARSGISPAQRERSQTQASPASQQLTLHLEHEA